jgi:phage terminase large subunit-like protein
MSTRGELVIRFIEKFCLIPSGEHVGKPLLLDDFEKRFIIDVYDNPLGTRRAYLSIAKKNGKTQLISAIVLAHVVGPEARRNTEIVSGAQSRDQAGIVFDRCAKMIAMNPKLARLTRIVPSSKKIYGLARNVLYKALSAEGKSAHGGSPSLAILDEVGQVEGPRDAFISAIQTSLGAYDNPLLIAISTQAASDSDLFSIWLDSQESAPDPRVVSHVFSGTGGLRALRPRGVGCRESRARQVQGTGGPRAGGAAGGTHPGE